MTGFSVSAAGEASAVVVEEGCIRRDLPSRAGVRVRIVEMARGAISPHVDNHNSQWEEVFVASGELIEGDRRVAA